MNIQKLYKELGRLRLNTESETFFITQAKL
jgi:hypothetical protein